MAQVKAKPKTSYFTKLYSKFSKEVRLCLDVGIEGWNWELELDLMNTAVWMAVEFRIGIGKPIPWN
jgi:hypothetical protein